MNGLPLVTALPAALPTSAANRLAALFDVHYDRLYRLARRLAPTSDDALDLVQETFLKAARASRSIPSGFADEEAWLVRILVNIRRDQWRKAAIRKRYEKDAPRSTSVSPSAEPALLARATVWRALDTLSRRRRAVIVMHELEGLAIKEIAQLLGITAITVRWHLSRGRRDLSRFLAAQIGDKE
jgi:RNA polymerase sigma-70 factor (ECF subfamily)